MWLSVLFANVSRSYYKSEINMHSFDNGALAALRVCGRFSSVRFVVVALARHEHGEAERQLVRMLRLRAMH